MAAPEPGSPVITADLPPWDPDRVDWAAVRKDVLAHRVECEVFVAQIDAEIRAACRPPTLREQERRAAIGDNIDTCDELLARVNEDDIV